MRQRMRKAAMMPQGPSLTWEANPVAYVGRNVFQVTGVDVRAKYAIGTIVYVNGQPAAVMDTVYTNANTYVYLADAVCYSGMNGVGRAQLYDGLTNLCTGGTAICGSYCSNTVNYVAAWAFDGVADTCWVGSEYPATNVSYIGYQFAAAQAVTWFELTQFSAFQYGVWGGAAGGVTSVNFRYSDNGSSWTSVGTFTVPGDGLACRIITPAPASPHVYWSLMPASNTDPANDRWAVVDLKMGV